jgi:hypothetical protein
MRSALSLGVLRRTMIGVFKAVTTSGDVFG